MMENYFNNTKLISILLKWKLHLLIISIIAVVAALLVSVFVFKPRFKSTAYIYPSNIAPYSEESETEQMLQWLNSRDVKDSVIRKHHLAEHYGISPQEKYFESTIYYLYQKNVKISKTQYESIEITVTDTDPVLAKDIVNSIIFYTDIKIRLTHRKKYDEVVYTFNDVLRLKQQEIDSVKQMYRDVSQKYGVYDIEGQTQEITRGNLRTVDGGGGAINSKDVLRLKTGMEEKAADLLFLSNRIKDLANEYSELMLKFDIAKYDTKKEYTFINVVTPPEVADKKSFPKHPLIVFYFLVATLFFSVLTIAIIEYRKSIAKSVGL